MWNVFKLDNSRKHIHIHILTPSKMHISQPSEMIYIVLVFHSKSWISQDLLLFLGVSFEKFLALKWQFVQIFCQDMRGTLGDMTGWAVEVLVQDVNISSHRNQTMRILIKLTSVIVRIDSIVLRIHKICSWGGYSLSCLNCQF